MQLAIVTSSCKIAESITAQLSLGKSCTCRCVFQAFAARFYIETDVCLATYDVRALHAGALCIFAVSVDIIVSVIVGCLEENAFRL
jgi:hypothetical protein